MWRFQFWLADCRRQLVWRKSHWKIRELRGLFEGKGGVIRGVLVNYGGAAVWFSMRRRRCRGERESERNSSLFALKLGRHAAPNTATYEIGTSDGKNRGGRLLYSVLLVTSSLYLRGPHLLPLLCIRLCVCCYVRNSWSGRSGCGGRVKDRVCWLRVLQL